MLCLRVARLGLSMSVASYQVEDAEFRVWGVNE